MGTDTGRSEAGVVSVPLFSPRHCDESAVADDAAIWLHGTRYKPRLLRSRSQ